MRQINIAAPGTTAQSLSARTVCVAICCGSGLLSRGFLEVRNATMAEEVAGLIGCHRFAEMKALRLR